MHRLAPAWLCCFLVIAVTRAAEPGEDSIATAKRELELIKAARQGAPAQPSQGPRPSAPAPEPDGPADSAWIRPTQSGAGDQRKRAANWLVDAMMEPAPGRGGAAAATAAGDEPAGLARERTLLETFLATKPEFGKTTTMAGPNEAAAGKGAPAERSPTEAVFNPLAGFLGDWMSSQDYALLGSHLQQTTPESSIAAGKSAPDAGAALASDTMMPTMDTTIEGLGAAPPAFAPPTSADNPYLHAFNEAMQSPVSQPLVTPTAAPAYSPVSPVVSPPPPPTPRSHGQVPDFAKPQADQKYFKQLKRF